MFPAKRPARAGAANAKKSRKSVRRWWPAVWSRWIQAQALGLCRSTTWTLLRGIHKSSGLSASTVNKILSAPRLPASVRLKVLEYVAEKVTGEYGDRSHRLKAYVRRLDSPHLEAGSLEVSTAPQLVHVAAT